MFEHPLALWLIAAAPVVALPAVVSIKRTGLGILWTALRLGVFGLLVTLLAGPRFKTMVPTHHVALVVAVDRSRSIAPDQWEWMKGKVANLAAAARAGDRMAVLAFGRNAVLASPMRAASKLRLASVSVDSNATDIAAALSTSLSLYPAGYERRLLLLSDGNETVGHALQEAPALVEAGAWLFAAAPPPSAKRRVALVSLAAPSSVRAYQRFRFRVAVESEVAGPVEARLSLSSDGHPIGGQTLVLGPGMNHLEIPYRFSHPGARVVVATLSVPGGIDALNTRADAGISVLKPPLVLIVSDGAPRSIVRALGVRHYRARVLAPGALSDQPWAYLAYQTVLVVNASAPALSAPVQEALRRYVADLGGGLIVTGPTLADRHFSGGALEKALPVAFLPQPPPRAREPVAVYLCIDRSNSMGYDSREPELRNFQRIRYAKRAAIALLNQLDDTDYVGVIAFDSQPYVLSHLAPLGAHRAELVDRIEHLQPGGGTDFKEALEIAEREILDSHIKAHQVILLTDGDTNRDYHDHDALIASYARDRIPLSTIRIGPDLIDLRLLKDFARATGGTFYRVKNIEKLPQLLVRLSHGGRQPHPAVRKVEPGDRSEVLNGIDVGRIPPADLAAITRAKEGSRVALRLRRRQTMAPLLALWQYGLGRSAILALDPDALTTLDWLRWRHYAQFWSQLVSWTMRRGESGPVALDVNRKRDGEVAVRVVAATAAPLPGDLQVRLAGTGGRVSVPLTPYSDSVYLGAAPSLEDGKYAAAVMVFDGSGAHRTLLRREIALGGHDLTASAELRLRPPNLSFLRGLAEATSGQLDASASSLWQRSGGRVAVTRNAEPYLIPFVLALLLAEIYVRRKVLGRHDESSGRL